MMISALGDNMKAQADVLITRYNGLHQFSDASTNKDWMRDAFFLLCQLRNLQWEVTVSGGRGDPNYQGGIGTGNY